ncbi:hypothetical protein HYW46_05695 [Candidatus Daviesbacteria bacterium]|nr:hypothetical protein [Candidatus Daviesbacteria bacterium]
MAGYHYPEDLVKISQTAALVPIIRGYMNLRRSDVDFMAHHPPLIQTENIFSSIYSDALGFKVDVGSTAHAFSWDILTGIIEQSPKLEPVSFPHPKWMLIAHNLGAQIKSIETNNVLTFETPAQFKDEVLAAIPENLKVSKADLNQNYPLLQELYMLTLGRNNMRNPKEWELRFRTLDQYLKFLQNHLAEFVSDPIRQNQIDQNIMNALQIAQSKKVRILEAIAQGDLANEELSYLDKTPIVQSWVDSSA